MSDPLDEDERLIALAPPRDDVELLRVGRSVEERLFGRGKSSPIAVSRYVLLREIARGGEGSVFAAYDPELDRKVAVKLLPPGTGHGGQRRLLREAQSLAKLDHPNVIPVHDVGTYDLSELSSVVRPDAAPSEGVYVVMEYAPGQNLRAWLAEESRGWREVVTVFSAAARGLAAAHKVGIIHRDFKPSNVIIGPAGRVRVVDFGLARTASSPQSGPVYLEDGDEVEQEQIRELASSDSRSVQLTEHGHVVGTPAFMSPEQHTGASLDARSDQYSFCAALYAGLYGALPFPQPTIRELESAKLAGSFERRPRASIPRWLDRLVATGLAPSPQERHASMDDVCRELQRARLRPISIVAGLLAVAGLGSIAWYQWLRTPSCPDPSPIVATVWSVEAKQAIAGSFAGSGNPYATEANKVVVSAFDDYAMAWSEANLTVCGQRNAGTLSEERADAATFCLQRALGRWGGMVQLFAEADEALVGRAYVAVRSLPRVSTCVERPVSLPTPPRLSAREVILAMESDIARARGLLLAGRQAEAVEVATAAVVQARSLEEKGPLAHALLHLGMSLGGMGEFEKAERTLHEAIVAAEGAGDSELAIECMAKLAYAIGAWGGEPRAGLAVLDIADARAEGLSSDAFTQRYRLLVRGHLWFKAEEPARAREAWQEGLRLEEAVDDTRPSYVADVNNNLGVLEEQHGRLDKAFDHFGRAWEIEQSLSPHHGSAGVVANNLGRVAARLGRYEEAVRWFERSLEILRAPTPPRARAAAELGALHASLGRSDAAIELWTEAHEILTEAFGATHPESIVLGARRVLVLAELGRRQEAGEISTALALDGVEADPAARVPLLIASGAAHSLAGRHDRAITRFSEALAHTERAGAGAFESFEILVLKGEGELALGDRRAAKRTFERALARFGDTERPPVESWRIWFGLAVSLEEQDPTRALSVAREAESVLRPQDREGLQGHPLVRWLEVHGDVR